MERVHLAVVAIVVAVLAFVGLQLFSQDRSAEDHFAADVVPGMLAADGTGRRLLPLSGEQPGRSGKPRKQRGTDPGAPGDRRRSGAAGRTVGGVADLIPGSARARGGASVGDGGNTRAGSRGSSLLDDVLAGGLGSRPSGAPQPRAARDLNLPDANPPGRQTFEFVDEDEAGGDAPLLSIPFEGDVDPQTGAAPGEVTGLVAKDDGVEFPDDARLTFAAGGHVNGEAGSISFAIEPAWAGTDQTNQSMVQIRDQHVWENTLQIVKNFNTLRFIIIDERGVERNINMFIDDWQPGESHAVTATWGNEQMSLYVDGNLVGQNELPNGLRFFETTPIHIGSDFPGTAYNGAGATIRDFQVYGRALSTDEVTRQ